MKKIKEFTSMEVEELIKIAGGVVAQLVKTNDWYCDNTKPCDTTDVVGCANHPPKPALTGCI
jgi:hypothetical protein